MRHNDTMLSLNVDSSHETSERFTWTVGAGVSEQRRWG